MIYKIDKNNFWQYKKIRLEALLKFPDAFLSTYQEELQFSDQDWIEKIKKDFYFGYFINDEIIGCVGLSLEKKAKIIHVANLFGMFVKTEYQGKNIAIELLNHVKKIAKDHGIIHLYLGCNADNYLAVKFYKKSGFKIYGTRPNYTKINDKFCDDLIMMLEL